MISYTTTTRDTRRANPDRAHRTKFARQAAIDAFGWRYGKALYQADFVDRRPGELPRPSPGAGRFK